MTRALLALSLLVTLPAFAQEDDALPDRIKSVQRRAFLQRGRFELAALGTASLNDAFFERLDGGLRLSFFPTNGFGLWAEGRLFHTVETDHVRVAQGRFTARLLAAEPERFVSGGVELLPFYGKAAVLSDRIVHFVTSVRAGAGPLAWRERRAEGDTALGAQLALSQRFFIGRAFMLGLRLSDVMYRAEISRRGGAGDLQHVLGAGIEAGVYFPFDFEHRRERPVETGEGG